MKIKMPFLILPSLYKCLIFFLSLLLNTYGHFFLSKIAQHLLDLGFRNLGQSLIVMSCTVQLKTATYCISVPLFVHFFLFQMKLSVADFSVPIGASVFKFCVHLQVG